MTKHAIAFGLALAAGVASAQVTPEDRCLLEALRGASPQATVGELRERCRPAAGPPPAAGSAATLGTPPAGESEPVQASYFEQRKAARTGSRVEPFALQLYRPNYLLPVTYQHRRAATGEASGAHQAVEAQLQISFQLPLSAPLFNGHVQPLFAYTGRAWWQVYDGSRSRPFREYNHEPELLLSLPPPPLQGAGWTARQVLLGFNHQSNGQGVAASRSWNRLTATLLVDSGPANWASLALWRRLHEDPKATPTDSTGDDNPDITRYLGHVELKLGRALPASHHFTLTARRSLRSGGKGALQADWSHPLPGSPSLRWMVHLFSGYGDSLIDYNRKLERIGLGVVVNDSR